MQTIVYVINNLNEKASRGNYETMSTVLKLDGTMRTDVNNETLSDIIAFIVGAALPTRRFKPQYLIDYKSDDNRQSVFV
jgi:hypothetical protein